MTVQSLVEWQTLNAYAEKSTPVQSGPFSQSLSQITSLAVALATTMWHSVSCFVDGG